MEFLDKSRSTQSRTHTTSTAPSPSLSPATIAFNATSNKVVDTLHSPEADPSALTSLNARNDAALQKLAGSRLPMFIARRDKIAQLLSDNEAAQVRVSEKTKAFWESKRVATEAFVQVYVDADKSTAELNDDARKKRQEYFSKAATAWAALKDILTQLNQDIIGPYVLGAYLYLYSHRTGAAGDWLTDGICLQGTSYPLRTSIWRRGSHAWPHCPAAVSQTTAIALSPSSRRTSGPDSAYRRTSQSRRRVGGLGCCLPGRRQVTGRHAWRHSGML